VATTKRPSEPPCAASIAAALEASGSIDVLVNNPGIGLFGAFEATPVASVREVFETNTFGVLAMTQAVLPHFPRAPQWCGRERDLERDRWRCCFYGWVRRFSE